MPSFTLPFQIDAVGIPPGDTGRGGGWFVVGDTDYGRAVLTAGDGKIIQVQITGVQKPRIRFLPSQASLASLTTLLGLTCDGLPSSSLGQVYGVTPFAVHRRQRISTVDTAPVPVIATMEQPANSNLSTIWSFDLLDESFVTTTGPTSSTDPLGALWTIGSIAATEFSLQLIDTNGGFHPYASLYIVDQFALTVDYTVPATFPISVGGGQACSNTFDPSAAGTGHGWEN